MKLYIIRHGQTDWNVQGRIQGRQDIPLNAAGRSQAQTRVRLNLKAVSRSPSDTNAPVDASASPASIPLTHNVSSHLHHLYPIQKKRKMACRIYRHTNQYTRPHYLDFILKCGLCWIICAIVYHSQTIFLRISDINSQRFFSIHGVERTADALKSSG